MDQLKETASSLPAAGFSQSSPVPDRSGDDLQVYAGGPHAGEPPYKTVTLYRREGIQRSVAPR